jgi:hypothetical protein
MKQLGRVRKWGEHLWPEEGKLVFGTETVRDVK